MYRVLVIGMVVVGRKIATPETTWCEGGRDVSKREEREVEQGRGGWRKSKEIGGGGEGYQGGGVEIT